MRAIVGGSVGGPPPGGGGSGRKPSVERDFFFFFCRHGTTLISVGGVTEADEDADNDADPSAGGGGGATSASLRISALREDEVAAAAAGGEAKSMVLLGTVMLYFSFIACSFLSAFAPAGSITAAIDAGADAASTCLGLAPICCGGGGARPGAAAIGAHSPPEPRDRVLRRRPSCSPTFSLSVACSRSAASLAAARVGRLLGDPTVTPMSELVMGSMRCRLPRRRVDTCGAIIGGGGGGWCIVVSDIFGVALV